MGLITTKGFTFDGVTSEAYGLRIGYFGGADTEAPTGLESSVERGDMNMIRSIPNQYGTVYEDTIEFEFDVFRCSLEPISYEDSRAINRWLTGSKVYKKFTFNDDVPENIHFYAICTNIIDIVQGQHYGKKLTFKCNAPYGFLEKKEYNITINGSQNRTFFNISDLGDYYPTVKFVSTSNGVMTFTNNTTGESCSIDFTNIDTVDGVKTVTIDGTTSRILDGNDKLIPMYKIGWDETSVIQWPKLEPDRNELTFSGQGTATLICEYPRKVGTI